MNEREMMMEVMLRVVDKFNRTLVMRRMTYFNAMYTTFQSFKASRRT